MSLDFQKQDCLAYAQKKNLEVERVFEERGESAKFADRPELIDLLEYCRKQRSVIAVLIVWKLDRLSRNQLDYYYLKRTLLDLGITIHSATEPTMQDSSSIAGKVFETFSALQAEIDNTIRSERAKRGLEAKINTGIYPWKPPIGYLTQNAYKHGEKKTKADSPHPVLFPLIQAALREYASGKYSQAELARILDEKGFAAARGIKTYNQIVNRLLYKYLNYYRGILINPWSGEQIQGQHEPMISDEEYLRITAVRDGRSVGLAVRRRLENPLFPLRRLIICPDCHKFYTGSISQGKTKRYAYYHCVSKGCPAYGKSIPRRAVEDAFIRLVSRYRLTDGYLEALEQALSSSLDEVNREARAKIAICDQRLFELREKRKRIYEMREDGSYAKSEFLERKAAVESEIDALRLERNEQTVQEVDLKRAITYARQFMARFGDKWAIMPERLRREFQNLIFPDGIEYRRNEGFGTPKPGPIFGAYRFFLTKKSLVAGWRGRNWNSVIADLEKMAELGRQLEDAATADFHDPTIAID